MSLDNARQEIFTYFENNFTSTEIVFDGSIHGETLIKGDDPWIYTYITWGDEHQGSMGTPNAYFIQDGILAVKIYSRINDGIGQIDSLTDDISTIFRAKQVDDSLFNKRKIDRDEKLDNIWNVRFISMPFRLVVNYQII